MSAVLTKQSEVTCVHGGTVQLGPGAVKLTVKGQAVLRATDVGPAISGCPFVPPSPPGGNPCTSVLQLQPGNATKLQVGGVPVLLDTTGGGTDSKPTAGTLGVQAHQSLLTAR